MFAFTSVNIHRVFGGHLGGLHRSGGIMLGAHLLEFGLIAILGFTAVALAINAMNDWVDKRYPKAHFQQVAGWGIFLAALIVLGVAVIRII
jgi:hypothetical protein